MPGEKQFKEILSGGDLRSIGQTSLIVSQIHNRKDFDALFDLLLDADRLVVMRAADAIEKITRQNTGYLSGHSAKVIELCGTTVHKELKWHLALLLSRLDLNDEQSELACQILTAWVLDKGNSRIVRVNALQAIYELGEKQKTATDRRKLIFDELEKESIPSINARIRILRKQIGL